jgi:hypothetical protein
MDKMMLDEFRGRALLASELVALQWEDVLRFYFGDTPPPPEARV